MQTGTVNTPLEGEYGTWEKGTRVRVYEEETHLIIDRLEPIRGGGSLFNTMVGVPKKHVDLDEKPLIGDGLCVVCRKPTPSRTRILNSTLALCDWCNGPIFDKWWDENIVPKLSGRLMANKEAHQPSQGEV